MIISFSDLVSLCKYKRIQTRSERPIIIHIREYINRPPLWKRSIPCLVFFLFLFTEETFVFSYWSLLISTIQYTVLTDTRRRGDLLINIIGDLRRHSLFRQEKQVNNSWLFYCLIQRSVPFASYEWSYRVYAIEPKHNLKENYSCIFQFYALDE